MRCKNSYYSSPKKKNWKCAEKSVDYNFWQAFKRSTLDPAASHALAFPLTNSKRSSCGGAARSLSHSHSDSGKPDWTRSAQSERHLSSLGVTPSATRGLNSRNMRHAWSSESGQYVWHHDEPYEERRGDQGSPGDAHVLHGSVALLHFLLLLSDKPAY